jgi:ABC-2 type transport system ATP-binding protein
MPSRRLARGGLRNALVMPAIVLSGVEKSFRAPNGRVPALRGVDMAIEAGETTALLGPNGAGKSTSIDVLLGLTRPDRGHVSLLGGDPRRARDAGAAAAMLQAGALIRDVSVRELLSLMATIYPRPLGVDEVLDMTGIVDVAAQRTQKLSGGQVQRARFALALISDPQVLVLDEPTVGMDVESRRAFWASMRRFAARGRTVLFATHYLEEADANADQVIVLADGQVVADGPTTAIRGRVGVRRIRATLPDVAADRLAALPGVRTADRRGQAVTLMCSDSDEAVRALLASYPHASDIEISGAGIEDAFVELTSAETNGGAREGAQLGR